MGTVRVVGYYLLDPVDGHEPASGFRHKREMGKGWILGADGLRRQPKTDGPDNPVGRVFQNIFSFDSIIRTLRYRGWLDVRIRTIVPV